MDDLINVANYYINQILKKLNDSTVDLKELRDDIKVLQYILNEIQHDEELLTEEVLKVEIILRKNNIDFKKEAVTPADVKKYLGAYI